jgi:hypothetical protein
MTPSLPRRRFLATAASGGALLGLDGLRFLPAVSAQEARLDPKLVRLDAEIEPLVRLIEDTPREKLLEEVASRVRRGTSYREVLAGLLLAGIRNVQPRPSVGFKFHAVLVVNSAHLASLNGPDADRWLPIFWALDHFKGAQADEKQKSGWRMGPVDETALPAPHQARQAFVDAMERWDEAAADAAAAQLARTAGAQETFELFVRYGARDFRSIGHKAIYVANGFRTLASIGWQHAEPILRSIAFALLAHEGVNPATGDAPADRPWKRNRELAGQFRPEWRAGKPDPKAAGDFLAGLRQASDEEAARKALDLLNAGVSPPSVWDALFAASGEILMRRPNILSLHALTTLNAIRYGFETAGSDETRRLLLLQAAAFVPLFRAKLDKEVKLDQLEPLALERPGAGAPAEIFADLSRDKMTAARKVLAHLQAGGDAKALVDAARVLIFLKGRDSHDYKFSSAVLEDYSTLSPAWRDRFLASSVYWLKGSGAPDNGLLERVRSALKT